MGSVQIDSDGAGGQKAQLAYTISTANVAVYCRVKFPTLLSIWATAWIISSGGNDLGLFANAGGQSVQWDNNSAGTDIIASASASTWYDFAIVKNGANVDIYWKISTNSTWNQTSLAAATFTPTLFTLGDFPPSTSLANKPVRYGKIVVWTFNQKPALIQAEANYRGLQDRGSNVWYYNPCSSAASFGTDQGPQGHNLTITGSPSDNADDPGFTADPPTITTQPQPQTKYIGQTASFSVSATGTGTLHYQWKKNGSNVGTDQNNYTTSAVNYSNNNDVYTVDITDDNGTRTSDSALLTVIFTTNLGWWKA